MNDDMGRYLPGVVNSQENLCTREQAQFHGLLKQTLLPLVKCYLYIQFMPSKWYLSETLVEYALYVDLFSSHKY